MCKSEQQFCIDAAKATWLTKESVASINQPMVRKLTKNCTWGQFQSTNANQNEALVDVDEDNIIDWRKAGHLVCC